MLWLPSGASPSKIARASSSYCCAFEYLPRRCSKSPRRASSLAKSGDFATIVGLVLRQGGKSEALCLRILSSVNIECRQLNHGSDQPIAAARPESAFDLHGTPITVFGLLVLVHEVINRAKVVQDDCLAGVVRPEVIRLFQFLQQDRLRASVIPLAMELIGREQTLDKVVRSGQRNASGY